MEYYNAVIFHAEPKASSIYA